MLMPHRWLALTRGLMPLMRYTIHASDGWVPVTMKIHSRAKMWIWAKNRIYEHFLLLLWCTKNNKLLKNGNIKEMKRRSEKEKKNANIRGQVEMWKFDGWILFVWCVCVAFCVAGNKKFMNRMVARSAIKRPWSSLLSKEESAWPWH